MLWRRTRLNRARSCRTGVAGHDSWYLDDPAPPPNPRTDSYSTHRSMMNPPTPLSASSRPSASERRTELLHLAIIGIRAVGPDATMDEIAATCGITKPILYRHFGGRDGLIEAMAEHFADMVLTLVDAQLASGAAGKEVLRTTLRAYFHFIETDSNVYQFVNEYPASASHTSLVDQLATRIGIDISRRRGGDSAPDPASLLWAHGIVGLAAQAGYWWVAQPPESRLQRDDAVELLLLGLDPERALAIPITADGSDQATDPPVG